MSTYLQKRGSVYYFRRPIPQDIRKFFRTRNERRQDEWVWSLGTKDRTRAKSLIPLHVIKTDQLIADARAGVMKPATPSLSHEQQAQQSEAYAMSEEQIELVELAYQNVQEHDHRMETDPDYAARMEVLDQAVRLREKAEDQELLAEIKREEVRANKVSLLGLFDRFASVVGRHPKTMAQWKPYIKSLVKFIGHDDANSVTHDEVVSWRNYLRDEVKYKGKPLTAKTINGSYLGALSALFSWAKGDGLVAKNPTIEVTRVKLPKQPQLREKEFTKEEWRTILSATLLELKGRPKDDFRYAVRWCPWLMAYSGARVGEITQLRKEDIQTVEGITCMRVTPEAGTVKTNEARMVPLHPHLIEQGFLSFVDVKPDGPLFYDPSLRRSDNAINRQANRLGSKIAHWVRGLGIEGVKPNHGWRHLFNTIGTSCSMNERARLAIMGHSGRSVNDDYGSVTLQMSLIPELNLIPAVYPNELEFATIPRTVRTSDLQIESDP
jgi:integrase